MIQNSDLIFLAVLMLVISVIIYCNYDKMIRNNRVIVPIVALIYFVALYLTDAYNEESELLMRFFLNIFICSIYLMNAFMNYDSSAVEGLSLVIIPLSIMNTKQGHLKYYKKSIYVTIFLATYFTILYTRGYIK